MSEFSEDDIANLLESIKLDEAKIDRYRTALEQIKLYHENMHGDKAKTFIAYDIAAKALAEGE